MRHRSLEISMAALLVLGAVSCRGCVLPDRNLQRTVAGSEVVGTWRMTPASLKVLESRGFRPEGRTDFTMTLAADGTVKFASADRLLPDLGLSYATLPGKWRLVRDKVRGKASPHTNVLELDLERGLTEPAGSRRHLKFGFDEVEGRLRLWQFYGDPDSWEFIEYVRDG